MRQLLSGGPIDHKIPGAGDLPGQGRYAEKQGRQSERQPTRKRDRELGKVGFLPGLKGVGGTGHERYCTCALEWLYPADCPLPPRGVPFESTAKPLIYQGNLANSTFMACIRLSRLAPDNVNGCLHLLCAGRSIRRL